MSIVKRLTPYSGLKVLISGGAAGIGEVIAAAYLETGAKVHVCDVSEQAVLAFRGPTVAAGLCNLARTSRRRPASRRPGINGAW